MVSVTLSVGLVQSVDDDTEQSVIARADEALNRAKQNGRNRVETGGAETPNAA